MPTRPAAGDRLVAEVLAAHGELEDDRLCELARAGDTEALEVLLERYTSYARSKAKTYFLIGADREDIVQEGMIGLFKAIRDYDPEKTVSFRSFAELCITRQIITAIKGATRQKHAPLNSYMSLHRPMGLEDDEGERQLVEFLAAARVVDPLEQVVAEDEVLEIRRFLSDILSDLEVDVLNLYLEGRSYQEIGRLLRRRAKSIDNALQRIKRKLEMFLEEREIAVREDLTSSRTLRVARFDHSRGQLDNGENGHGTNGNGNGTNGGNGHGAEGSPASDNHADRNGATAGSSKDRARSGRSSDLRASLRFASRAAIRRAAKRPRPPVPEEQHQKKK